MSDLPSDDDIGVATRMGRRFAKANRPVTDCPYNADGTGADRVLARRFVAAYRAEKPLPVGAVDYSDG